MTSPNQVQKAILKQLYSFFTSPLKHILAGDRVSHHFEGHVVENGLDPIDGQAYCHIEMGGQSLVYLPLSFSIPPGS